MSRASVTTGAIQVHSLPRRKNLFSGVKADTRGLDASSTSDHRLCRAGFAHGAGNPLRAAIYEIIDKDHAKRSSRASTSLGVDLPGRSMRLAEG
jgi:hypothetical protein